MRSVQHDGGPCPRCHKHIDGHSTADDHTPGKKLRAPRPGDLAVCMYCGAPLFFDQHRRLALLTEEVVDRLAPGDLKALLDVIELQRTLPP